MKAQGLRGCADTRLMEIALASTQPVPLTDVFTSILLYAFWAELVGVPVAWLRVRKMEAWRNRPRESGSIRLLSIYIVQVTGMVVAWAILMSTCVVVGSRL